MQMRAGTEVEEIAVQHTETCEYHENNYYPYNKNSRSESFIDKHSREHPEAIQQNDFNTPSAAVAPPLSKLMDYYSIEKAPAW